MPSERFTREKIGEFLKLWGQLVGSLSGIMILLALGFGALIGTIAAVAWVGIRIYQWSISVTLTPIEEVAVIGALVLAATGLAAAGEVFFEDAA